MVDMLITLASERWIGIPDCLLYETTHITERNRISVSYASSDSSLFYGYINLLATKYYGMETIKVNGHIVQLFDSIDELPILRSFEFKKYLLQDMGIGDSIADVDDHLEKLFILKQIEDIQTESKNLRFNFFNMLSDVDLKSRSFACLVKSIDNQVFKTSEEAYACLLETDINGKQVKEWLENVKKKLILRGNYDFLSSTEITLTTLSEYENS